MKWIFKIIESSNGENKIREVYVYGETKAEAMRKVRKNYLQSSIYSYQFSGGNEIIVGSK